MVESLLRDQTSTQCGKQRGASIREQTPRKLHNGRAIFEIGGPIHISGIHMWRDVDGVYQLFLAEVPVPPARAVALVNALLYGAMIESRAFACPEKSE
jgi:hypothetical protein